MGHASPTTQAQLEVVSPAGELHFYPLNSGEVVRLGRGLENGLVLDCPGVAPVHLILDHRQTAYWLLLLGQGEEARLNGQPLHPQTAIELHHLDIIELSGYSIILLSPPAGDTRDMPKANPAPFRSTVSSETTNLPVDLLDVRLSARRWTVDVGQTAFCQVTISNNAASKVTSLVNVVGVDENWLTLSPPQVELEPGEQARVILTITPPRLPTSSAGLHSLAVIITSPNYPDWHNRQEVILTINPYYEFAISNMASRRNLLSLFQSTEQTVLTLTNKSNRPALFRLTSTEETQSCHFEFQLPGETASLAAAADLRLSPSQAATIPIQIIPPPRPSVRLGPRVYPYTITATLLEGRLTSRSVLGQITSVPLIGPWLISLVIFCLVGLTAFFLQTIIEQTWSRPIRISLVTPVSSPPPTHHRATATPTPSLLPTATPSLTYDEIFQAIAPQYGLDWRMLAEQAYQESGMNPLAVGRHNDMGLMQIIPSTWNEWAPKLGVSDPFDPYSNVQVAAAYLAYLRDYCQARGYHETYWMFIGYNWGPQNLQRLFASQGGWAEVPEKQRQYATVIMEAASGIPLRGEDWTPKTVDTSLNY